MPVESEYGATADVKVAGIACRADGTPDRERPKRVHALKAERDHSVNRIERAGLTQLSRVEQLRAQVAAIRTSQGGRSPHHLTPGATARPAHFFQVASSASILMKTPPTTERA